MKAFNNICTRNIFFLFFSTTVFLFFTRCSDEKLSKKEPSNNIQLQDSSTIWITKSKNKKYTREKRLSFLKKAYLKTTKKQIDSNSTNKLSEISLNYSKLKDSLWFRKTNKESIKYCKIIKDSTTLANSYWDLAYFLENNNVRDSAFFYYQSASKLFSATNQKALAGLMYQNMAWVQQTINDNTGAEITCIKAIELVKTTEDYKKLSNCYSTLGVITNNLGELDKSIEYYNEALKYDDKRPKTQRPNYNILNNIGVAYNSHKKYDKAISYFKQLTELDSLQILNPGLYATSLNNLAYSQYKINELNNVETNYKKALKIRKELNETAQISGSHYNLGLYYLNKEKDTLRAEKQALLSKKYAEESKNNERLLEVLELLALTTPKKASDYRLQQLKLTDSLQKEERKTRNKFARIRFETDEFIAENVLLEKEKQLWTGIAIGLILLLLSIYVILSQRSKNQKLKFEQEQQAKNQEVFNLMLAQKQKVEEAKRLEQKRISEELHDGVLGKMLGARMILTGLNKKNNLEAIEEKSKAIIALKNVEGEVRSISHELNHSAYQKIPNFINSITELLESHSKSAKIKQDFIFDNMIDWDTLSGDIKINVYRMIQECIHNSIKHANCSKVYVNFELHQNNFEVTVGDDGKGYNINKEKKGIGLRNIKSRMEKLNGHFTVDTAPGRGTSFFFSIPITEVSRYEENEIPIT